MNRDGPKEIPVSIFLLRNLLGHDFTAYLDIKRKLQGEGQSDLVGSATDLTIESFPRCANSFALGAFKRANPGRTVASHTHLAAQVKSSIILGVPTLVILREPLNPIASLKALYPNLPASLIAWSYLRFHRSIYPLRKQLLFTSFEKVTSDFDAVIAAINQRFGRSFLQFQHSESAVQDLRQGFRAHGADDKYIAMPSVTRNAEKQRLGLNEHSPLIPACREIYLRLLEEVPDSLKS